MGSLIKELLRPRHSKMAPVMPNLFKIFLAPADYIEPVNTLGLPRYAKATPSHNNKAGKDIFSRHERMRVMALPE
jgi:hypothetical protein